MNENLEWNLEEKPGWVLGAKFGEKSGWMHLSYKLVAPCDATLEIYIVDTIMINIGLPPWSSAKGGTGTLAKFRRSS